MYHLPMGAPRSSGLRVVVLLTAIGAYLWSRLFAFPVVPVLLGGDQAYFWMYAARILRGDKYTEIFSVHTAWY